jgi:hypothetical protein
VTHTQARKCSPPSKKSSTSVPLRMSYCRTYPSTQPTKMVVSWMRMEVIESLASSRIWMGMRCCDFRSHSRTVVSKEPGLRVGLLACTERETHPRP